MTIQSRMACHGKSCIDEVIPRTSAPIAESLWGRTSAAPEMLNAKLQHEVSCLYHTTTAIKPNMAAPQITLYVDIVSPFAYIAFHVLRVCAQQPSMRDIILIL